MNPYPDPDLKWEHGFLFKRGASNHFYSTTLESTEDWEHYARMGERGTIGFWDGPRPEINTASGEENLFQVALVGDIAWGVHQRRPCGEVSSGFRHGRERGQIHRGR